MNASERIKKARGLQELTEAIEPMAQAMAKLSEEARQQIGEVESSSKRQAEVWNKSQEEVTRDMRELLKDVKKVSQDVTEMTYNTKRTLGKIELRIWGTALLVGCLPTILLVFASLLLLDWEMFSLKDGEQILGIYLR